jgi:hypothetical protein
MLGLKAIEVKAYVWIIIFLEAYEIHTTSTGSYEGGGAGYL